MQHAQPGYTVIDKRGEEKDKPLPCRVCGCPTAEHSKSYLKPTMECIQYLREQVALYKSENIKLNIHATQIKEDTTNRSAS